MPSNPYALGRVGDYNYNVAAGTPEYAVSQPEYADPRADSENGYIDNPASAGVGRSTSGHASIYNLPVSGPSYEVHQDDGAGTAEDMSFSSVDYPSAQRVMTMPPMGHHNDKGDKKFYDGGGITGVPSTNRSTIGGEELRATNFKEDFGVLAGDRRWVDSPRRNPPATTRPTQTSSPSNYRFMRPFDQFNRPFEDMVAGTARHLNGEHFSMADHRRDYEILGMAPARTTRNTYRLEPTPWDENLVDQPPAYSQTDMRIETVDVPTANKSYRLM